MKMKIKKWTIQILIPWAKISMLFSMSTNLNLTEVEQLCQCQVMADMKKVYDNLRIINLYNYVNVPKCQWQLNANNTKGMTMIIIVDHKYLLTARDINYKCLYLCILLEILFDSPALRLTTLWCVFIRTYNVIKMVDLKGILL